VTSAVYAARMLGGSVVVAALGPLGSTPHGAALARFAAIGGLALAGAVATTRMAPRTLSVPSDARSPESAEPRGDGAIEPALGDGSVAPQ
jgi:hypothetical protein